MERKIISLKDFIEENGKILGETIEKHLTPVWKPGETIFEDRISTLLRKPFPVQKELIKGLAKALYQENRRALFLCGEMGTGKTTIALSVVACSSNPLRVLVVCPTHLVEKWLREAKLVIPEVVTVDLAVKNAISVLEKLRYSNKKPETTEVYVISKERAKLSYSWKPVFIERKNSRYLYCPDCGQELIEEEKGKVYTETMLQSKKYFCPHCGAALWQATPQPRRYSIAEYIKKYLGNKFDMLIMDEIHDYKAGDTLQGNAMGMLVGCSKYLLALTGTLSGGYATDLFYLLFRTAPAELKEDGFDYNSAELFLKQHGVLEYVYKLDSEESYRYGRATKKPVIIRKRPGISPAAIGKYLLYRSCFIRLADVIEGLPPYDEFVISIDMHPVQKQEYLSLQLRLQDAVRFYKTKVTAAMLQSLLCYPDSCVVFEEQVLIKDKNKETGETEIIDIITAPLLNIPVLPKEQELINLCKQEKQHGRKVLVYIVYTGTRDIRQRVKSILEKHNLKVGILPETVEPKKREEWLNKHSDEFDVLITNPELVKLGLDLYQYPTIVFFEVGYNIFTLRQAARRSWRIGQKQPVKVYYFCYKNTMQEIALTLVAKKLEQALLAEGDLPEGLGAVFEESSIIQELARALVEGRHYSGAESAWAQMRKKEIESNLGLTAKESIFTVQGTADNLKSKETASKLDNVLITVAVKHSKKKSISKMSVKYSEIDDLVKQYGAVQFNIF